MLIHGLGLTWRSWRPVLPALHDFHEVAAVDLPGFGAAPSLGDRTRPTPEALADALEAELDALGWGRPALVGNSPRGWLAPQLPRPPRAPPGGGPAPPGAPASAPRA